MNAPRALSVPARSVLHKPSGGSFRKRLMGSVCPCSVAMKRCLDTAVCSVRRLDVSQFASKRRTWLKSCGSGAVPRKRFA